MSSIQLRFLYLNIWIVAILTALYLDALVHIAMLPFGIALMFIWGPYLLWWLSWMAPLALFFAQYGVALAVFSVYKPILAIPLAGSLSTLILVFLMQICVKKQRITQKYLYLVFAIALIFLLMSINIPPLYMHSGRLNYDFSEFVVVWFFVVLNSVTYLLHENHKSKSPA